MKKFQKGASVVQLLIIVVLLGFSLNFGLRIAGMQWDDYLLNKILVRMTDVVDERTSEKEFRELLFNRLQINDLTGIPQDALKIDKRKGVFTLSWDYERRQHVFANVDILMTFNHKKTY